MKFTRVNIYGFGKWVDKEITFNTDELNVIYGENESGKTTLQQFIMFILFGLTPKEQTFFQPAESSKFGGLLTFIDENNNKVTIERTYDSLVINTQGKTYTDEKVLSHYLNGLTKQIFMSIYSFSAIDLLHIRNITEQEFGNILFNVGLAGATNIEIAERNIERETGRIFKKAGRIPSLNQQLQKLEELTVVEQKLKKQEAVYTEMKSKHKAYKVKLEHLIQEIDKARGKSEQLNKQLHLLPTINELKRTKESLSHLPTQIDFPESGIKRLEQNKEKLVPLVSNQTNIEKNTINYKEELSNLKESILPNEVFELTEQLIKDRSMYERHLAESEELTKMIEKNINEVNLSLLDLAIPLSRASFIELTLPYYLNKTWKTLEEEAYQLNQLRKEIEAEQTILENELENIELETNDFKKKLLPIQELDELKEQLINYSHTSKQAKEMKNHQINQGTKRKILTSSVSIMIFLIILSVITKSPIFIYSTIGMGIVIGGLYYLVNYFENKNKQLIHALTHSSGSHLTRKDFERIKKQVDQQDNYLIQLKYLENEKQKVIRGELQVNERLQMFNQRKHMFDQKVLDEQKEYEFLKDIEPIHWNELLTVLKGLKEKEIIIKENKDKNSEVNEILNVYEIKLSKVLHILSISNYEQLKDRLETHKEADQLISNYNKIINNLTEENELLNESIKYYETEISKLFNQADVKNEEKFHQKYHESEENKRLTEQVNSYYSQLKMSINSEMIDYLLKVNKDDFDLEQEISSYKLEINRLDKEIEDIRNEIASLEAELKQMEETEEYSNVLHKVSYEQEKAKELAFEWAALKLAIDTLEETKRSFHQKYMKDVIKKASHYFKLITKEKYVEIFPPEKNKTFSVETNRHTRFTINQLSQGTIDQLYVSLRLAISAVMSEKYSVPFLIDDAFVHFDHKREKAVMMLLEEITKDQQVVLFTCKKHLLELTSVKVHYLSKQ